LEYWKYIREKARHSHPLRLVVDGLWKMGISVRPFYVFQEGLSDIKTSEWHGKFDGYKLGFLDKNDMGVISAIPFRNASSLEELLQRLREGKRCLGMKHGGELVAFTWCNFDRFDFESFCFDLSENEAYLFDAYTLEPYRGKGIAPYLRDQIYRELDLLGKKRLYSVSDCFNTPAVKFKMKLNARIIELGLFVELFGKWRFGRIIKKYEAAK
jgi:GNAT superfamily N-acetyltransferase